MEDRADGQNHPVLNRRMFLSAPASTFCRQTTRWRSGIRSGGKTRTTSGLTAPIYPTNTGKSQYEFYNYSPASGGSLPANPQEVGNQFFNSLGTKTLEAGLYYNDYMNTGTVHGINVQNELYNLTTSSGTPNAQVAAAIQVAFANYITFLKCAGELTGTDGTPCTPTPTCGDYQG